MPKKTARRIIDTKKSTGTTIISGVTLSGGSGGGAATPAMAGDGLTYNSGVLDVGAGTLVTVGADSVGITAGANYQYIGTGAGTAAAWQNLSTLAGSGLTHSAGVLAVGAGNGITVNADDVALTTPGTLTATSTNNAASNHTHAVTTGAASTLTVSTSNATGSSASLARADHLHTITSSADVTAGGTALLASSAGNLKLATGNIGTTLGYNGTFTSGFAGAGWRVDYGVTEAAKASATFDNLTIRGRMRVYELLIQQIRATNGSVLVSSSSKVLTVSADDDPTWTVNGATLQFNGVDATLETTIYTITTSDSTEAGADRTHYHGFLTGDLIRAQQMEWDGSGFAGVFQSDLEVTAVTDLYTYTAARAGTTDAAAVGYDYVRIGSASDTTRQGVVYLTSDDDNAPFIDIVDGITQHSQWNTAGKIRARLGRLDGITDAQFGTLDGYGLWSDNVYLTGSIYATDGIFNGTVYATDGIFSGTIYAGAGSIDGFLTLGTSGGIYQGTGTAGTPTTGLKIYQSSSIGQIAIYDGGTKTMRIAGDDVRMLNASAFADIRTIKWLEDTDYSGTWSDLSSANVSYSYIGGYRTASEAHMYVSSRVNNTGSPANTRHAVIDLVATRNESSTLYGCSLQLYSMNSTYSYDGVFFFQDGYLDIENIASTPSFPITASTRAQVYIKGGKFIIRYNDGGTYRYKYLDLTGTGSSWTHTTTAP